MVGLRHSSLAHLLDKGSPLTALFGTLSEKWAPGGGDDEAPETAVYSSRNAVDLAIGSWNKTGRVPHEILRRLAGHHVKGVYRLTYLAVNGDGLVSLRHPLFVIVGGEYKEGTGDLWAAKGEIPADRIPEMAKLTHLQFVLNTFFQGTGLM